MFERPHHQHIATILESLDADLLRSFECLFGGGTAIALRYGEFRESVDIDFMVSNLEGYRSLRHLLTGIEGISALARNGRQFNQVREVRADQYGIRTAIASGGENIKFEIVLEGRIAFAPSTDSDLVCGVSTLTPLDMAASKLLANSDRWADDSVFSRDLIDLAMMHLKPNLLRQAVEKAKGAYGQGIPLEVKKAVDYLAMRPGRLQQCLVAMHVVLPRALVWQGIKRVARLVAAFEKPTS